MGILFVGAEDIDFNFIGGAQSSYANHSGYMETAYSRVAIRATTRLEAKTPFNATEAWLHFCAVIGTESGTTIYPMCGFWSAELNRARITLQASLVGSGANFEVDDGTGTYIKGSTFTFPKIKKPSDYDLHAKIDGLSVTVEFYSAGELLHRETFAIVQTYTMTNFRLSPSSNYTSWGWLYSQVIVADEPTIGWKLKTLAPAAAGDLSEFSGTFADINETTLNNDTKISADQSARSSFKPASWNVPAGFEIVGVSLSSYALSDLTATISNFVRLGGQNYADTPEALGVGWANYRSLWPLNPATDAPWQPANINGTALQFGIGVTV